MALASVLERGVTSFRMPNESMSYHHRTSSVKSWSAVVHDTLNIELMNAVVESTGPLGTHHKGRRFAIRTFFL